uniref:Uncharacterized protein n=1 Tax=Mycena chlorophos TaxID=658473 RepID=A0ABQ0LMX4_MYCCL|nr:predicted protein [Mycena chlorophos]
MANNTHNTSPTTPGTAIQQLMEQKGWSPHTLQSSLEQPKHMGLRQILSTQTHELRNPAVAGTTGGPGSASGAGRAGKTGRAGGSQGVGDDNGTGKGKNKEDKHSPTTRLQRIHEASKIALGAHMFFHCLGVVPPTAPPKTHANEKGPRLSREDERVLREDAMFTRVMAGLQRLRPVTEPVQTEQIAWRREICAVVGGNAPLLSLSNEGDLLRDALAKYSRVMKLHDVEKRCGKLNQMYISLAKEQNLRNLAVRLLQNMSAIDFICDWNKHHGTRDATPILYAVLFQNQFVGDGLGSLKGQQLLDTILRNHGDTFRSFKKSFRRGTTTPMGKVSRIYHIFGPAVLFDPDMTVALLTETMHSKTLPGLLNRFDLEGGLAAASENPSKSTVGHRYQTTFRALGGVTLALNEELFDVFIDFVKRHPSRAKQNENL